MPDLRSKLKVIIYLSDVFVLNQQAISMISEKQHEIVPCCLFQSFGNVDVFQTDCCLARSILQRCRKDQLMHTLYVVQLF